MKNLRSRNFCSTYTTATSPNKKYPKQWMLDVNDRYQKVVGLVTSFSTALIASPILFLKESAKSSNTMILSMLDFFAILGGIFLLGSIISGIFYAYGSAKWVKLAWGEQADILNKNKGVKDIEKFLDLTYASMMVGFLLGGLCMIIFMVTHIPPQTSVPPQASI